MQTRYVDPDAAIGGSGATNALSGATCAYRSLNVAEAALPASLTEPWTIVCESNGASHTADTTQVIFAGSTCSATNYITIQASAAARHAGVWSASKYRLECSGSASYEGSLRVADPYLRVDGIQIRMQGSGSGYGIYIPYDAAVPQGLVFSNLLVRCDSGVLYGFHVYDVGANSYTVDVRNSALYGATTGVYVDGRLTLRLQNCTIVAGTTAVSRSTYGVIQATNCYASATTCYSTDGDGTTLVKTTCASSDATGTAGLTSVALSTSTGAKFTNITSGSEDFHLQSGSALINVGTDLSGTFTTDIDGVTRTGTWDIGADEYVSAGGTTTPLTLTETATLTQTLTLSTSKPLAENGTITDSATRQTSKRLAETGTVTDSSARRAGKPLADTSTVTDAATRSTGKPLPDTATVTDSIARAPRKALSETATLTDVITAIRTYLRAIVETASITDSVARGVSKMTADAWNASDVFARKAVKALSESATLTDSVAALRAFIKIVSETLTITDAAVRSTLKSASDTLSLVESWARSTAVSTVQTLSLTDTVATVRAKLLALAETFGVTDTIARGMSRVLIDTVALTDTSRRAISKAFTETVSWLDSLVTRLTGASIPTGIIRVILPAIDGQPRELGGIDGAARTMSTIDGAPRQLRSLQ